MKQAKANLIHAQQQFERTKSLQGKGFIGQSALVDSRRNVDVAETHLRTAKLQVEARPQIRASVRREKDVAHCANGTIRIARPSLLNFHPTPANAPFLNTSIETGLPLQMMM